MKLRAKLAALGLSVVLLGGIGMIGAAPASAAPAPTCLKVTHGKDGIFPKVTVKNNCTTAKRVKVIWAYGQDSRCVSVGVGGSFWSSSGIAARFDGLVNC